MPARFREKRNPTRESLESIDKSVRQIQAEFKSNLFDWFSKYAKSHRIRLAYDLDYTQKYGEKNSKIVEFGSIPLLLTTSLKELNFDVQGVDIDPDRFETIIKSLNLRVAKANIETENLPLPDNHYDIALFNELFEHLRINPINTMAEVKRVLKPGGILLLSTPNLTSLKGWINLLLRNKAPGNMYQEYQKLEKLGHMGHVREYTAVELTEFLEQSGFIVKEVIYRGAPVPKKAWKRLLTDIFFFVFPRLRRYFSIVAIKE